MQPEVVLQPPLILDPGGHRRAGTWAFGVMLFEATASDDGIIGPLTFSWETAAGPDDAIFSDADSPTTEVWFPAEGVYEVTLSAYDGFVTVSDSASIVVYSDNDPPVIDAGFDLLIDGDIRRWGFDPVFECSAALAAGAIDDGPLPVSLEWSAGPVLEWVDSSQSWESDSRCGLYFWFGDSASPTSSVRTSYYCGGLPNWPLRKAYKVDLTISANDGYHTVTDQLTLYCRSPFHPDWEPE